MIEQNALIIQLLLQKVYILVNAVFMPGFYHSRAGGNDQKPPTAVFGYILAFSGFSTLNELISRFKEKLSTVLTKTIQATIPME